VSGAGCQILAAKGKETDFEVFLLLRRISKKNVGKLDQIETI
jgi:hypothetical protein